jgi:hypothetical protein
MDAFMRGDTPSRYAAYAVARQWGWFSADDVRELEDMNPIPDGKGALYLTPMNMIPAGQIAVPAPARSIVAPVFADACDHIHRRESADILAEARKSLARSDVAGFESWLTNYTTTSLATFVAERLAVPIQAQLRAIGNGNNVDDLTVQTFAQVQAKEYGISVMAQVTACVQRAQYTGMDMLHVLESWYAERAQNSPATTAMLIMNAVEEQIMEVHRG